MKVNNSNSISTSIHLVSFVQMFILQTAYRFFRKQKLHDETVSRVSSIWTTFSSISTLLSTASTTIAIRSTIVNRAYEPGSNSRSRWTVKTGWKINSLFSVSLNAHYTFNISLLCQNKKAYESSFDNHFCSCFNWGL